MQPPRSRSPTSEAAAATGRGIFSRGWRLTGRLTGQIDLYDVDRPRRSAMSPWPRDLWAPEAKSRFAVRAVRRLSAALRGAEFVLLSIEPGPIELRYADLEIPARYGVLQPVGDTTGPGGILRGLRAVPTYANSPARSPNTVPARG